MSHTEHAESLTAHNEMQDRLAPAVAAMRQSPSASYSVSTLASLTGMSRSQFAHAFRESYGRSPMEFLRRVRLDSAALLLKTTDLPIKTIAARVGYESRSTFTHAFRSTFGVSPEAYRQLPSGETQLDIHLVSARLRAHSGPGQELAWEVNLQSGKVWWSDATFQALGYESVRRTIADVARFYERVHPDDRQNVVESMQAACFSLELTWKATFRFLKADNRTYVNIANACLILRSNVGAPTRLIGALRLVED